MSGPSPYLMWAPTYLGLFFFFAFGATVGSFINVVVYRLPRGQGIVRPPSACPACGTRLTWRENLPIIGWIMLRGRCRFCKSPISAEYPIVETIVALLFGGLFALWFADPGLLRTIGVTASEIRPEWTAHGFGAMWPMYALTLFLIGSLVAITLIDARTYLIPISILWLVIGAALVTHPLHALWIEHRFGGLKRSPFDWTIWTFDDWSVTLGAFGACLGIGVSLLMVRIGWMPRSFADYEEWEREAEARHKDQSEVEEVTTSSSAQLGPILVRTALLTGPAIALMAAGFTIGLQFNKPMQGMFAGMAIGLLIGLVLRRFGPGDDGAGDPIWVQYPYARREILWEILFLAPVLALGAAGYLIADAWSDPQPLWINALTGSIVGLLVGGGMVWAIRILGTLAFGKEAMGLGDVHLMAAVGAVLGWIDPVLAFFIAPFFGIAWTVGGAVISRFRRDGGTALPYGPHLAAATIVIVYAKPAMSALLSFIAGQSVTIP